MALNFPPNPSVGDTWVVGSKTYRWSGMAWLVVSAIVSATHIIAELVTITSSTQAFNTYTGALTVVGGVGIGGDLWVGGTFYAGGEAVLTTSSFNASLNAGTDIRLSLSTLTNAIIISNTSTLQTVTGRGSTTTHAINITNLTDSNSTITGAIVVSGGIGAGGRITCESLRIEDTVFDSTMVTTNSVVQKAIDAFSLNNYRTSKYLIQIDEGTTATAKFHAVEIMLIATNTGTSKAVEYGEVSSEGPLGTFSSDVQVVGTDTVVTLYFTPFDNHDKTVKVLRTSMTT